jgi:hypothetical protein
MYAIRSAPTRLTISLATVVLPEPVPPATAMVTGDVLMDDDYTSLPARIF